MKLTAVICEYNLFHLGHKRQIELIHDTGSAVLALMSGNWAQRGEACVLDKYARAEAALRCGADIVLELPYPWSGGCAEHFAGGGVALLEALGGVDSLCFGCEEFVDAKELIESAENLLSPEYEAALKRARALNPGLPDIPLRAELYKTLYGGILPEKPNDILALEYVKAITAAGSRIKPFPIRREGGYTATEARALFAAGDMEGLSRTVPPEAMEVYLRETPVGRGVYGDAVMANLRMRGNEAVREAEDCGGGLGGRIKRCADEAGGYEELLSQCATKKYTDARIRRACRNSLFGTTRAQLTQKPTFTMLLALGERGREIMPSLRGEIVLTKPAHYKRRLGEKAFAEQWKNEEKAEAMFALMRGKPSGFTLTGTPFIKVNK